jgi:hypothetical protein
MKKITPSLFALALLAFGPAAQALDGPLGWTISVPVLSTTVRALAPEQKNTKLLEVESDATQTAAGQPASAALSEVFAELRANDPQLSTISDSALAQMILKTIAENN